MESPMKSSTYGVTTLLISYGIVCSKCTIVPLLMSCCVNVSPRFMVTLFFVRMPSTGSLVTVYTTLARFGLPVTSRVPRVSGTVSYSLSTSTRSVLRMPPCTPAELRGL